MDAAIIYSLIFILAASRIEGTKVVVSIPEGEVDGRLSKIMEMIANVTKQEKNHWLGLKREIEKESKSVEAQLKELMKASNVQTFNSSYMANKKRSYDMEEIVIAGGTPGASSEYDARQHSAADAFKDPKIEKWGWTTHTTSGDLPPVYIWYDFKREIVPAMISYLPRATNVVSANEVRVKRFQFVGTDDTVCSKKSNWMVLCEGKSAPYKSLEDENGCIVPIRPRQNFESFRCLGLKSLDPGDDPGDVSLRGIRFWQYQ